MRAIIDSFQAGDTVTRKTRYEDLKAQILKAGRFSVFEATANQSASAMFTRLCVDPEIEVDHGCGYPWTTVKRRGKA